jgi:hypothetical protein
MIFTLFALVAMATAIRVQQATPKKSSGGMFTVPLTRVEKRVNVHLGADHVAAMLAEGATHVQVAGKPGQGPVSIPIAGKKI